MLALNDNCLLRKKNNQGKRKSGKKRRDSPRQRGRMTCLSALNCRTGLNEKIELSLVDIYTLWGDWQKKEEFIKPKSIAELHIFKLSY